MLPQGASASNKVPAVLETHGWGGRRARTPGRRTKAPQRGLRRPHLGLERVRGFGRRGERRIAAVRGQGRAGADRLPRHPAGDQARRAEGPPGRLGRRVERRWGPVQHSCERRPGRRDRALHLLGEPDAGPVAKRGLQEGLGELLYNFGLVGAKNDGLDSPAGPQTGDYAEQIHDGHAQGQLHRRVLQGHPPLVPPQVDGPESGRIAAPTLIVRKRGHAVPPGRRFGTTGTSSAAELRCA